MWWCSRWWLLLVANGWILPIAMGQELFILNERVHSNIFTMTRPASSLVWGQSLMITKKAGDGGDVPMDIKSQYNANGPQQKPVFYYKCPAKNKLPKAKIWMEPPGMGRMGDKYPIESQKPQTIGKMIIKGSKSKAGIIKGKTSSKRKNGLKLADTNKKGVPLNEGGWVPPGKGKGDSKMSKKSDPKSKVEAKKKMKEKKMKGKKKEDKKGPTPKQGKKGTTIRPHYYVQEKPPNKPIILGGMMMMNMGKGKGFFFPIFKTPSPTEYIIYTNSPTRGSITALTPFPSRIETNLPTSSSTTSNSSPRPSMILVSTSPTNISSQLPTSTSMSPLPSTTITASPTFNNNNSSNSSTTISPTRMNNETAAPSLQQTTLPPTVVSIVPTSPRTNMPVVVSSLIPTTSMPVSPGSTLPTTTMPVSISTVLPSTVIPISTIPPSVVPTTLIPVSTIRPTMISTTIQPISTIRPTMVLTTTKPVSFSIAPTTIQPSTSNSSSIVPTTAMPQPPSPPTMANQVAATPFCITYTTQLSGIPSTTHFMDAASTTCQHIQNYIMISFMANTNNQLVIVDNTNCRLLNSTSTPMNKICYNMNVQFNVMSVVIPNQSDVNVLIMVSLMSPTVDMLIAALNALPSSNPIASTSSVTFMLGTRRRRRIRNREEE